MSLYVQLTGLSSRVSVGCPTPKDIYAQAATPNERVACGVSLRDLCGPTEPRYAGRVRAEAARLS